MSVRIRDLDFPVDIWALGTICQGLQCSVELCSCTQNENDIISYYNRTPPHRKLKRLLLVLDNTIHKAPRKGFERLFGGVLSCFSMGFEGFERLFGGVWFFLQIFLK